MSDMFSIDKFRTHIASRGDLAKPSKFMVEFPNGSQDLSFVCEAAELPGYTINTSEAKIGALSWHIATTSAVNEIQLTFLCTSKMEEKAYFDTWIRSVNYDGYQDSIGAGALNDVHFVRYLDQFSQIIRISQLPESGGVAAQYTSSIDPRSRRSISQAVNAWGDRYIVQLEEAFPISMQPLPLNWGDTDGVHRLQVTFKYTAWRRVIPIEGEVGSIVPPEPEIQDGQFEPPTVPMPEIGIPDFSPAPDVNNNPLGYSPETI